MDILNSKDKIIDEINTIIESYHSIEESRHDEMKLFTDKVSGLNQFNNKLLAEIREKDKILSTQEKTIHDYSVMINDLQEKTKKEISDKEKFDMIKAQDKEIHLRDQKIKSLEKKIEEFTTQKSKKTNNKTLVDKMKDITESQKDDKEVVEVVEEDLLLTGDPVDEKTSSEKDEDDKDPELFEVETHKEAPSDDQTSDDELEEKVETPKEEKVETPKEEKVETPKEAPSDDDQTSDDELEVEIITHYKKDYYIKTNEKDPQYIYAIDDGDIGDVVGEIKGKKKVLYDK